MYNLKQYYKLNIELNRNKLSSIQQQTTNNKSQKPTPIPTPTPTTTYTLTETKNEIQMPSYRGGGGGRGYSGNRSGGSGRYHGGGGRGGGRSSGGRSRGRGHGHGHGHQRGPNQPHVVECTGFLTKGNCEKFQKGQCTFDHSVVRLSKVTNSKPKENTNTYNSKKNYNNYNNNYNNNNNNSNKLHPTTDIAPWLEKPDSPLKIFTASQDGHWRLYNTTNGQFNIEVEHNLNGPIHTLLVKHNFLFCGFEAISSKIPNQTVGMILAWNLTNPSDPPMELHMGYSQQSSNLAPYAHSKGVTCLITHDNVCFSGGKDHMIRIWKFDTTMNQNKGGFQLIKECCGHVGDVTGLVFWNGMLWSSSVDGTIRIWDSGSNWECKHLIVGGTSNTSGGGSGNASPNTNGTTSNTNDVVGPGHTAPITSMILFEQSQQSQQQQQQQQNQAQSPQSTPFIITSSLDGTVKVWDSTNGNCLSTTLPLDCGITTMAIMKEPKNQYPILILGCERGIIYIMSILQTLKVNNAMSYLVKLDPKYLESCGHDQGYDAIHRIEVGPEGTQYANTFYSAGDDGNMVIWQIVSDMGMT